MSKHSCEEMSTRIKKTVKSINPNGRFDEKLYFYYDESNNIRKYQLKQGEFNNVNVNFSLAGIVTNEEKEFSKQELFDRLGFENNDNFKEFKFKHLAKKGASNIFEELATDRFSIFLNFLIFNNLYLHVSVLNVFYYGTVDIIDDVVAKVIDEQHLNKQYLDELKDFVYSKMILKYEMFAELFSNFRYPNIQPQDSIEFLEVIKNYFETTPTGRKNREINNKWLEYLDKKIDTIKSEGVQLVLLMNNQDEVLIKNFSELYTHKLFVYDKSSHTFDEEEVIISYWEQIGLSDSSIKNRYDFKQSENNIMLQISDVIAGIFAKLFDYLAKNSIFSIKNTVSEMDKGSVGYQNLKLFMDLVEKTNRFDSYLLQFSIPNSLRKKFNELYHLFH
ncbi:hypothetical protein JXW62_08790 [Streptococcus suis]|uniref:DUF3800 domain-containing protein n=1 Tax=Streptococcus suis TaxID=1307 RepID=UPI001E4F8D02|nr:DUF3800 domain-containing protein [Streptococcus suis]MCB2861216.1 hypothetical protein [Streptococcus suis]MCB2869755.1 hypothetical protein [Streptococcus suis]HEM3474786.1 hypothetical protein [Streptococcus suis]HEM3505620.1 hypothetical protein [Streptococcus suis]